MTAVGCSTTPRQDDGVVPRLSAEALYNEAPWVNKVPTNVRKIANMMVDVTQGLADMSATYQRQLELQNQAQWATYNNTRVSSQRSANMRDCLGVGGGIQGGMKCESIGYAAFKSEYVDVTPQSFELAPENLWPPKTIGWTQAREPLFTELQAIELGQAMYGGGQAYGGFSRAAGRAARGRASR
ncbi:MAG: hypothetical protein NXH95_04255 [Pseudomonadaceae bacterium]|nr:hypothetical protein [Pseudomonadaceae bacterium]